MESLAVATTLLDAALAPAGLTRLLAGIGFSAAPIALTDDEARSIGLSSDDGPFMVSSGQGSLRAIAFDIRTRGCIRPDIARVANRLVSRAPHLLWIVAARDHGAKEVAIGACAPALLRGRVAALLAKPGHIVGSDAETICALAAVRDESDLLIHARWLEILGRENVGHRFFRALERSVSLLTGDVDAGTSPADAAELALLYTSRLLFLSFLETKGWLNRDHAFLANGYADCMVSGGSYHRRVLAPLFFGTLNTHPRNRARRAQAFGRVPFLNGGLFSRSSLERGLSTSTFSDESLGALFADVLTPYRFTAREDTSLWSEAAVDPEMLGRAFESLMSARARKTSGAFYTPQTLVSQLTRSALSNGLCSRVVPADCVSEALAGEIIPPRMTRQLMANLVSFRLLDPACGSGAFLVHALEELSTLRQRLGEQRPLHEIRRTVLTGSIFGVDINPTAVWLCELRLWLSMAIENPQRDPMRVATLPNLDRNIRIGDSLLADPVGIAPASHQSNRFALLRSRYTRATGARKRSLGRLLDKAERMRALEVVGDVMRRARFERRELLLAARSRDLFGRRPVPDAGVRAAMQELKLRLQTARRDARAIKGGGALPFSFATHFADAGASGGFDVVIGNPPWIRTHNLDPRARATLRQRYAVYRNAAWQSGAQSSGAGRGFSGQVDTSALFVERSVSLARPGGMIALIVPSKLWRSLAGGGVRTLVEQQTELIEIHDLTGARQEFDAAVYPSLLLTCRSSEPTGPRGPVSISVHRHDFVSRWSADPRSIPFDETPGSPWVMLPTQARTAFDTLVLAGVPLASSRVGRPTLGVKTGCNEAFLPPHGSVEPEMVRPLVRGQGISAWRLPQPTEEILWTHDRTGRPLRELPPRARAWLARFRSELDGRSDSAGAWWSLFRVESSDASRPRVVWSDVSRSPKAALIPAGDNSVAINSCYVVTCPTPSDALTLTALLNSPVTAAWLNAIAEPAQGGYHRYLGWTMSILPVPKDWSRATQLLAPIAARAIDGVPPEPGELTDATLESFGISYQDFAPLLRWDCR